MHGTCIHTRSCWSYGAYATLNALLLLTCNANAKGASLKVDVVHGIIIAPVEFKGQVSYIFTLSLNDSSNAYLSVKSTEHNFTYFQLNNIWF